MTHAWGDILRQRIFGIACGYADANDADGLAEDPIQKLLLDRDPISGGRLASQPTISRFENALSPRTLYRLSETLADTVIARHRRPHRGARRITVDVDVTEDPTHGAQLSFFNGFYGGWCYLPLMVFVTFDDEPRQLSARGRAAARQRAGRQRRARGAASPDSQTVGRLPPGAGTGPLGRRLRDARDL